MANIQITLDDEIYNIPIDEYPYLAQGATFKPYTKQLAGNKIEIGYTNDFGLTNPEPVTLEFPPLSDADRTSYNGQLYDTIGERIDADIQDLQNKIDSVSYEGTSIHADNTAARNLTVNGNRVEVLGQTIQNCLDHSSADKFNNINGSVGEDGYIDITSEDGTNKSLLLKKDYCIVKPNTQYTLVLEIAELQGFNQLTIGTSWGGDTIFNGGYLNISNTGIVKKVVSTISDFSGKNNSFIAGFSGQTGSIKFRFSIVEGDWTEKDISWVPFGLNYPETTEIVQCGKNLINEDNPESMGNLSYTDGIFTASDKDTAQKLMFKIQQYDYSKKYIKDAQIIIIGSGVMYAKFIKLSNCKYLRFANNGTSNEFSLFFDISHLENNQKYIFQVNILDTTIGACKFKDVQLTKNGNETNYSPYSGSNVNIDYPLKSINDEIRDRIYTLNRKVYYEQNIKEVVFDGSDDEIWNTDGDDRLYYHVKVDNLKNSTPILCDKAYYVSSPSKLQQGTCSSSVVIIIGCDRELYPTVFEWRQHLLTNPIKVLYQLETPIVTEIAIEDFQSYAEQTNWVTTNAVKPYLKASIPFGIDASEAIHEILEARVSYDGLKFDSLGERLDHDFNEVRGKVDVVNYKGTTIHANNTYARNLVANRNKVEVLGQTIQNLIDDSNIWRTEQTVSTDSETPVGVLTYIFKSNEYANLKPKTTYTAFFDYEFIENTLGVYYFQVNCSISDTDIQLFQFNKGNIDSGVKVKTFTTPSDYKSLKNIFLAGISGSAKLINKGLMILEGNWAGKDISYVPFGLNYPETTEVVECGKNLFDVSKIPTTWNGSYGIINNGDGSIFVKNTSTSSGVIPNITLKEVCPSIEVGKTYILNFENDSYPLKMIYFQKTKSPWTGGQKLTITEDHLNSSMYFYPSHNINTEATLSNFQIEEAEVSTDYEPYTERRINIDKPLASVSDTVRDRYYVKDGKKYHEQVVKEIVLKGTEELNLVATTVNVTKVRYHTDFQIVPLAIVCNRLNTIPSVVSSEIEGTASNASGDIYFSIANNKLETQDINGIKKYIQANNLQFLVELATPITTEIETEDWYSFDGQTNITTTNTVKPTLDIDIPSDLTAVVSNLMIENSSLQAENQALTSELENQKSSIETQQANVDYISMMTGVDL